MIEVEKWLPMAFDGLHKAFGPRLRYLGLQGSYRRGEATESSDLDLVTILDEVSLRDLDQYRAIVRALPEGDKACGFICEETELSRWPRHELFPFKMDTRDFHGRLEDFIPSIDRAEVIEGVRISSSALLHFLRHSYIYASPEARPGILKESFKAAYFVILVNSYLMTGIYCSSKKELLKVLEGTEKIIVSAGLQFSDWLGRQSEQEAFDLLIGWAQRTLMCDFA